MNRLLHYARRHQRRLVWGAFMLLFTNAAAMAVPQLFRLAVDTIDAEGFADAADNLRAVAVAMLIAGAAGAGFRVLSRVHLFYAGRDIELELRGDLYRHLARQPPAFFEQHPTGDLMSRATNDLTQVRLLFGPGLLNLVNTVIAFAAAIPLMVLISPKLTLIALGIYLPGLVLVQTMARRLYLDARRQQETLGEMGNFVQESLTGAHVVRAFGLERHQAARFATVNYEYYRAAVRLAFVRSYLWRLMAALAGLGMLAALVAGAIDVMAGRLTLGDLVALLEYLALLAWPSFALGWLISLAQRGLASMARISSILDVTPVILSGNQRPAHLEPTIELRGLAFTVADRPILTAIEARVPKGNTLGIVGPIGSGKTTLVRSLVREIDVAPGQVWVGGHDITTLDFSRLRRSFGFVHQRPLLFSKTVAENVAFGRPDASEAAIREALDLAAFTPDLKALPQGIDTPVGERGITLSGGQKQRVAIARAFLLAPAILVLDDALASIDAETETAILEALRELRRGKTTIIVAHRVSAVQRADEIIVLWEGRLKERGTHADLLARGGFYAQIARRQELERGLESPAPKAARFP